jgi:hypothetical protein
VLGVTCEAIRSAPKYDSGAPVTQEYEDLPGRHFGVPPRWFHEKAAGKRALDLIGTA